MEYDKEYQDILNKILTMISKEDAPIVHNETTIRMYKDITEGLHYAKRVKYTVFKKKNIDIPFANTFIPKRIVDIIKKTIVSQYVFNTDKVTIQIGIMKNNPISLKELKRSIQYMYSWLHVCNKYAKPQCNKHIEINLFFTNEKKKFPVNKKVLENDHANSAYSTVCNVNNKIVIFRYEEWFKVFIHETCHAYGLEPSDSIERQLSNTLSRIISIPLLIRVSESYVETWARIVNVFYSSILNNKNYKEFIVSLGITMKIESLFSIIQASRILKYMNLKYERLLNSSLPKTQYTEYTHIFAYYILTASFMCNPFDFLSWCNKYNRWIQYNDENGSVYFNQYIYNSLTNETFKKKIQGIPQIHEKVGGLKHTIVKLPIF